jgi:hypothetical protein
MNLNDQPPAPRRGISPIFRLVLWAACLYVIVAYGIMPSLDRHKAHRAHYLADQPTLTHTGTGLPGDPLTVGLVGSEEDVVRSMIAAGWLPADPLTFDSSVRIAVDTVFRKPDNQAPVSNLFLFGRKEDLAFEKPVGHSPKERHHVRFWRTEKLHEGRPVWIGSAAFDVGVELSKTTGEVTHHISPDIDAERDLLLTDLTKAGRVAEVKWIDDFQKVHEGKNGGGDPWKTDGRLAGIALRPLPPPGTPVPR